MDHVEITIRDPRIDETETHLAHLIDVCDNISPAEMIERARGFCQSIGQDHSLFNTDDLIDIFKVKKLQAIAMASTSFTMLKMPTKKIHH